MNREYVLGIDIGGTNLRLALIDSNYKIYKPFIKKIVEYKNENIIEDIIEIISSYLKEVETDITAIGIGVPGIVKKGQEIISCPNITGLEGIIFYRLLSKNFGLPVFIDKDVNMIMLADYNNLGKKYNNIIGIYIGTGFGNSMILNGQLYTGSRGFAGELGHIHLKGMDGNCNCGNEGCLELHAAGKRLQKIADKYDIDIDKIFLDADLEESEINEFVSNIAIGTSSVINIIDPELVVLGGGVIKMKGFPLDKLTNEIRYFLRTPEIKNELKIVLSPSGKYSGCIGAAIYCFSHLQLK